MVIKKTQKNAFKYMCIKCDFNSNNKYDYSKHLQTKKHNGINGISNGNKKTHLHECKWENHTNIKLGYLDTRRVVSYYRNQ